MRFALVVLLSVCSPAFAQNPFDIVGIEERLSNLEERVSALEGKPASTTTGYDIIRGLDEYPAEKCPCPLGGKCICPPGECDCPNCPEHGKKVDPEKYLLAFKAAWCGPCKEFEAKEIEPGNGTAGFVLSKEWLNQGLLKFVDADADKATVAKYGVTAYPTFVLVENGEEIGRRTGYQTARQLSDWFTGKESVQKTAPKFEYSPRELNTRTVQDDFEPKPIAKTSPQYTYPKTGYNAVARCTVNRLHSQHWTWPGNLGQHLASSHGFSPAGFSHQELVTIHDNFHNTGRSGVVRGTSYARPTVRYAQPVYRPQTYFSTGGSYCPSCVR